MLAEARKALFVMVGFLAILWIIQLVNVAGGYHLASQYAIRPREASSLPNILAAPFLHLSWTHIEGNSGPLFIFGFLAAYRGVVRFLGLTLLIIVVSGFAAWLTASSPGVGASGVVFGYLGYILVRGLFDRHLIDIVIGAVMALCFAYQFTVLLPHAHVGWQDHIGGLVAGLAGGWIFRERRASRTSVGSDSASAPAPSAPARAADVVKAPGRTALPPSGPSPTGQFTGPRADLHKELDDLGI
jgi:membrane associated rhomboid family serine protease